MKKILLFAFFALFVFCASAQEKTALETAKATLKAHGGDKFVQIKTLVIRGSGTVTQPGSVQTIPVSFANILSNEKYRFDLDGGPLLFFKQIFNGRETYCSMDGVRLPPTNLIGLPILGKIGETGFVISDLPEKLSKKKGFRITTPQGYYTDFIIDEKTFLVKEFRSNYKTSGGDASTSVEIDKYREVGGAMINEKYAQRLEVGQFSSYGDFKAKEIVINGKIDDDVFLIK